ncbi:MAG TPA: urease accessory protein UreF [Burkholderiales bacterium]|nr:urease accessory protein UreF [Burkholderiales bacterium]
MRRSAPIPDNGALLRLLQLASPSLPVGAYSYSEGLEFAVEQRAVADAATLQKWLEDALQYGGVRVEAAVLVRAYDARIADKGGAVCYWNEWLTAARESEEIRMQNHEMGRALFKLLVELDPPPRDVVPLLTGQCNFAVAFAVAAAHWGIARDAAVTGYLQTWTANIVGAGVKLIPLGQTAGQRLLWDLRRAIEATAGAAATIEDDDLAVSNWGQALASMQHETQYSRLFRS